MQPALFKQLLSKSVISLFFLVGIFIFFVVHFFLVFQVKNEKEAMQKSIEVFPLTSEYSPDELIVQFYEGYVPKLLNEEIARREELDKTFLGKTRLFIENGILWYLSEDVPEKKLIFVNDELKKSGVINLVPTIDDPVSPSLARFYLLSFQKNTNLNDAQNKLSGLFFIKSIEPNVIFHLFATPNDQYYPQLWGLQQISMPQAWDTTTGSESIIVGVIDSGLDINHPEFSGRIVAPKSYISGETIMADDLGHGTHVAGTIGAIGNNSIGVVGVNWNIKIMPLRICHSIVPRSPGGPNNECFLQSMPNALNFAIANGARVINMSLGGVSPCTPQIQNSIDAAISKGIVVIVAAGNKGEDANNFAPSNCQNVITVGATDQSDSRAIWNPVESSNYGSNIEIAAPGSDILSTVPGGYGAKNGTSMASPHVAGAAALLLSINPGLAPKQVADCITQNADPISTDRPIGGKRLNVLKVISVCKDLAPDNSSPTEIPTAIPTVPTIPTQAIPPQVTILPSTSPVVTNPPVVNLPIVYPSPLPGEQYYTCTFDPSCSPNTNTIQLCPLKCTPL